MGSANMAEKVRLRSSDGRVFEADVEAVMSQSRLLKNVIEDTGTDDVISVPDVPGDILELVIQFCEARYKLHLSEFGRSLGTKAWANLISPEVAGRSLGTKGDGMLGRNIVRASSTSMTWRPTRMRGVGKRRTTMQVL